MVEFYFNFGVRKFYDSSPDAIQENVDKFDYIKNKTKLWHVKNTIIQYLTIDKLGENICDVFYS